MTHIPQKNFQAAIIDMDGVLTRTAGIHAQAWKQMFDEFLKKKDGQNFLPLDLKKDYRQYIDGIPRFDGVRNFLKSRNVSLPEGLPGDEAGKETIHGLGRRKNEIFLELLDKEGVEVYEETIEVLKKWKENKMKLAVISSSRNCKNILDAAGLTDFFDARVDGETLAKEGLKGKPEPDIFLRASELLGVENNKILVLEDAILGVQAAKKGKFGLVVGIARSGEEKDLKEAGADVTVKELSELDINLDPSEQGKEAEDLPHALLEIKEIFGKTGDKKIALFLDYDGTLTPIISDPDKSFLSEKAKDVLRDLSKHITISVISGRDRKDLLSKIGIDSLIYAGSHGFDISGPNGLEMQYEEGRKSLPALDEAEKKLKEKLSHLEGVLVERKKYAIAVHYRNVPDENVKEVKKIVYDELDRQKKLKKGTGKKILELKPNLDWDKGRALGWIMNELQLNDNHIPIFIGDDITDEDALDEIRDKGIGIIVGRHSQKTSATYRLESPEEVMAFFEKLKTHIKENLSRSQN